MTSSNRRQDVEMQPIESAWRRVKVHLESRLDQIVEDIRHYPTPIPACDLQFNTLLEERSKIARELIQLHDLSEPALATEAQVEVISEFIASSAFVIGDTEREICSLLETARSNPDS